MTTEEQKLVEKIGSTLKKLREAKGIGLREMAIELDVDHSWLSKIENGKKDIKVVTLVKLAKALDVKASSILLKIDY